MTSRGKLLSDGLQLASVPTSWAVLAQPWLLRNRHGVNYPHSGWHGLTDSTEGIGWFLVIAVVFGTLATLINRRWAHITALVITVLCALATVVSLSNITRDSDFHDLAASWTGGLLASLCGACQAAWLISNSRGSVAGTPDP